MLSAKLELIRERIEIAKARGLAHVTPEDTHLDGRRITLQGREVVSFGFASYIGLEMNEAVKDGACDAVRRFGALFSSSRAYLSCPLYAELEALLEQIVGAPIVVAQTTSLAHFAALPVLVQPGDAVLFDRFVHNSVQAVMPTLREADSVCAAVSHNDVDELERQVEALRHRHSRIWYAADGIYSMTGEVAPLPRLQQLLDRYEQLHLYIDDAHGMSWTGLHGRGTVIGTGRMHPRIVVALSLGKAFAAGGAVLVFPDRESARLVRACGSTLIYSGQLQPALLGAAIASARIHLSAELVELQQRLSERIDTFNALSVARGFELASTARTPIRLVKVGSEAQALDAVESLLQHGFYTNGAVHPAVPRGHGGIRIALTVHHTLDDIRQLVDRLSGLLFQSPRAEGTSLELAEEPWSSS